MHQKQPPAKVAVAVGAGVTSGASIAAAADTSSTASSKPWEKRWTVIARCLIRPVRAPV